MKSFYPKQAFTIVELLVVIAMILFLAALLMPTLGRVKETARNAKCVSNLRQIAMATFTYAADNDGFGPSAQSKYVRDIFRLRSRNPADPTYKAGYPTGKWFPEYLGTTVNGTVHPVSYCPSGGRLGSVGPSLANPSNPNLPIGNNSYGINPNLIRLDWFTDPEDGDPEDDKRVVPLTSVAEPQKVCLWTESTETSCYGSSGYRATVNGPHFSKKRIANLETPVAGPFPCYQYLGRSNVIFVDQHVASFLVPGELPEGSSVFWKWVKYREPNHHWGFSKGVDLTR